MATHIELFGCREGNLKGVDVRIPYGKLSVITGVSGSGKSSLAFRTIFAEGRRRIIESLDPRESYFISDTCSPKIDMAIGLPPAIAIKQTQYIRNPKSTLGSISHINPFVFLLYAICGDIPCAQCSTNEDVWFNSPHLGRCTRCESSITKMQPGAFSNLSPTGMCQECGGVGVTQEVDETLLYPDQKLTIGQGGLAYGGPSKGTMKYGFFNKLLNQFGFDNDTPIEDLSQEAKVALLFGIKKSRRYKVDFPGLVPMIMKALKETRSEKIRSQLQSFVVESTCQSCDGYGINPKASAVILDGTKIHEMLSMDIVSLVKKLKTMEFRDVRDQIASLVLGKTLETAETMIEMGIGYLSLSRRTASLSGGEMHRARMAAQLASQISGVVYVLDEPSSGLHTQEVNRLISIMYRLRDIGAGNTILAVEHDADIIRSADHIIELGPGASRLGGNIVYAGSPQHAITQQDSVTGKLLSEGSNSVTRVRRQVTNKTIGIRHAQSNNLKNVDVDIPLNCLVAVTGVSGSGKSSLVFDSLCCYDTVGASKTRNIVACELVGREHVDEIIMSTQAPIGRSTRSVVGTYVGVFTLIRAVFAKEEKAKKIDFDQGHFSFNTPRGSCQTCGGYGTIEPDYPILGGAQFVCPECGGKRFSEKVLSILYKGASIADVLEMDISTAAHLFKDVPAIAQKLTVLEDVGLGYLTLGESSVDLSGGEAQRVKLAVDLMRGKRGNALYVFDEPSAGLHVKDIGVLVDVFEQLLNSGNSIVIVEHNLHLIWASDYVIDMGPDAGESGGCVIATAPPTQIAEMDTATGLALKQFLNT